MRTDILLSEKELMEYMSLGIRGEFTDIESTDEIAALMEEKTLKMLENDLKFMAEFPMPSHAIQRLAYLAHSEDQDVWVKFLDMYDHRTLVPHLKEVQRRAVEYIRDIKPAMMESFGLTEEMKNENPDEYNALMNNLRSCILEMVNAYIIEE